MTDEQELTVWRARFSTPDICTRELDSLRRTEEFLRTELGQASRELVAVAESLRVCRLERGVAQDQLSKIVRATDV